MKKMRENPNPQIIVREEELESHLRDGWQFVSVLPSQRSQKMSLKLFDFLQELNEHYL
jgi:hypothetical protein